MNRLFQILMFFIALLVPELSNARSLTDTMTCLCPVNLNVADISATEATIVWNGSASSYLVKYGEADSLVVNDASVTLTQLMPNTAYAVKVRSLCGSSEQSEWSQNIKFRTMIDCGSDYVNKYGVIGNGTNTSSLCLAYCFAEDVFAQGVSGYIFTASEIGAFDLLGTNLLQGIKFHAGNAGSLDLAVYVGHTDRNAFGPAADDSLSTDQMTQVFDGTVDFDGDDWTGIYFDNPFLYNGEDNLAIVVRRNTPATNAIAVYYTSTSPSNTCYNGYRSASGSPFALSFSANRPDMGFVFCSSDATCSVVENITASDLLDTAATVSWTRTDNTQHEFVVAYGTGSNVDSMTLVHLTDTFIVLSGLVGNTEYNVMVKSVCDFLGEGEWSVAVAFTTLCSAYVFSDATPLIQDFESGMACWEGYSVSEVNTSNQFYGIQATRNHTQGGEHSYMMNSWNSSTDYNQYLISPELVCERPVKVTYWYRMRVQGDSLYIGFSTGTDAISDFGNWKKIRFSSAYASGCDTLPANTKYVAFRYWGNCAEYANLDDISLEMLPPDSVTITVVNANEGMGSVIPSPGIYRVEANSTFSVAAAPFSGHHFDYWSLTLSSGSTNNLTESSFSIMIDSVMDNLVLTSHFAVNTYHLIVTSDNDTLGTVSGTGAYNYGDTATIAATPAENCHFVCWNDGDSNAVRQVAVVGDIAYTAFFERGTGAEDVLHIDLVANNDQYGFTIPEIGSYEYHFGDTVVLFAIPKYGSRFICWTITNGTPPVVTNPVSWIVDSSMIGEVVTITAHFSTDTIVSNTVEVRVAVNDRTMGTTRPQPATFVCHYGDVVDPLAIPNEGYRFINWTISCQDMPDTSNPIRFFVDSSMFGRTIVVTANFAPENAQYTLTLNTNDPSMGVVTGSGVYNAGDTARVVAIPNDGYKFVKWKEDNNTNAERLLVMVGDMTLTAVFSNGVGIEESVQELYTVYHSGNRIIVCGADQQKVTVFDMLGRIVAQCDHAGSEQSFAIASSGIYLVRIGNNAGQRVAVYNP